MTARPHPRTDPNTSTETDALAREFMRLMLPSCTTGLLAGIASADEYRIATRAPVVAEMATHLAVAVLVREQQRRDARAEVADEEPAPADAADLAAAKAYGVAEERARIIGLARERAAGYQGKADLYKVSKQGELWSNYAGAMRDFADMLDGESVLDDPPGPDVSGFLLVDPAKLAALVKAGNNLAQIVIDVEGMAVQQTVANWRDARAALGFK